MKEEQRTLTFLCDDIIGFYRASRVLPLKVNCLCEVGSQIFCEKTGSAGGGWGGAFVP